MGWASQTAGAQAAGGGSWIRDGVYKFMIEKCLVKETNEGWTFVAELRVLEAKSNGEKDKTGAPVIPNAVGSSCSYVQQSKFKSAPGNLKAFALGALGALGYTEDKITEQVLTDIAHPKNPLRGIVLGDETFRKPIQSGPNAGTLMTLHKWRIVPQGKEDIKKAREYLASVAATADVNSPKEEPAAAPARATQQVAKAEPAPITASGLGDILGMDF